MAGRLRHRVQLTTDGHRPYLAAVEDAFGADIDYAVLQKLYGAEQSDEKRYSPAVCIGTKQELITGAPNPRHISTSYVERQNLTIADVDAPVHAGSRGSRMRSRRRSRTTRLPSRSTSCGTTSRGFTRRCA